MEQVARASLKILSHDDDDDNNDDDEGTLRLVIVSKLYGMFHK